MRYLVLSYFHMKEGSCILHSTPDGLDSNITDDIRRTLDLLEGSTFFIQHKANYITVNWYFSIPSKFARGFEDNLLLSLILLNDDIDPKSFKKPLELLVNELKGIDDLSCALHTEKIQEIGKTKVELAQNKTKIVMNEFKKSLPKEITAKTKEALKFFFFGLDKAGKTTIINYFYQGVFINTQPTLRANIVRMLFSTAQFTVYDMAGQRIFRNTWEMYLKNPHILVFIVDAADLDRIEEAKEELWKILESPKTKDVPLLILANKIDLENVIQNEAVSEALELKNIQNRVANIIRTSAITGEGIYDAFTWIFETTVGFSAKNFHRKT